MSVAQSRDLQDQKALVTGATSGIGRAIALQLARDGAEVIVHGRDAERGAATVQEIVAAGGRARFVEADLGKPSEVRRLAREAGDVDVLVNNAGLAIFGPTAELDIERFDALFAGNVRAPFMLVDALAPGMVARGKGSIVNISSMAGVIGLAGAAAYGATKASLASMTRAWAAEFSASGVRVNAVAPGPVHSGGDRRSGRLPRLATRELRHRRRRRGGWRPHRDLACRSKGAGHEDRPHQRRSMGRRDAAGLLFPATEEACRRRDLLRRVGAPAGKEIVPISQAQRDRRGALGHLRIGESALVHGIDGDRSRGFRPVSSRR